MLSKTSKSKLIKVCKVLFPKYKYVKVNRFKNVITFTNCRIPIISWFYSKQKIGLNELIESRIPIQLADFKYNNRTFVNFVHEDLVRCTILNKSKIDYFLEEVTKIKYADVYKRLNIASSRIIEPNELIDNEELLFNEMVEIYSEKPIKVRVINKRKNTFSLDNVTIFYILLLIIVTLTLLL